jgi:hypothetical protein
MIWAIRAELLKLRTTWAPLALFAVAAGFSALGAAIKASNAGGTGPMAVPPLNTAAGVTGVITSSRFGLLVALAFGVIMSTAEYRHRTATFTYLARPNRIQVLIAKGVAAAVAGPLYGLVGAAAATGVGLATVSGDHYHLAVSSQTIVRYALGAMVGGGLLAAVGVGIGTLVRAQVEGVVAVFAWGLVVETALGNVFHPLATVLPVTAAEAMAGMPLGSGKTPLPFAGGVVLLAGVAAVLAVAATRTTLAKDVT